MRFPVKFTRYVGTVPTGGVALGSDTLLVDSGSNPIKPTAKTDNSLSSRIVSNNGWPLERVVLAAKYTGGMTPPGALNVTMYVFEDSLNMYIPLPQSATTITPGPNTAPGNPVFFDAMSLIDFPHVTSDFQANNPGTAAFLCIVANNGSPPNGTYEFALGAELTSKPF